MSKPLKHSSDKKDPAKPWHERALWSGLLASVLLPPLLNPALNEVGNGFWDPILHLHRSSEGLPLQINRGQKDASDGRTKERKGLFRPVVTDPARTNVGLILECETSGSIDEDRIENTLLSSLHNAAPQLAVLGHYGTPEFSRKGYFEKVFQDQDSILQEAGALSSIDYLLLCKFTVSAKPNPEPFKKDLVTSDIGLVFRLLDKAGRLVNNGSFSGHGPGSSEEEALDRGIEMMVEQHASQMLAGVVNKASR